jgi:hypothetical protein
MAADTAAAAAADPTATHPGVAAASPGGKFLFGGASAPSSTFYGLGKEAGIKASTDINLHIASVDTISVPLPFILRHDTLLSDSLLRDVSDFLVVVHLAGSWLLPPAKLQLTITPTIELHTNR